MSAWTFLREFLRDPAKVGALAPSGRALAELEVGAAGIEPGHVVVELGAGTGPMTAALLEHHSDNLLICLEPADELADCLEQRFPSLRVHRRFAQDLPDILAEVGATKVDRVVSSLPWAAWSSTLQDAVFEGIEAVLAPDGRMVTFTYAHTAVLPNARRFRSKLHEHFDSVHTTRIAWANIPPAFVYVCDTPRPRT